MINKKKEGGFYASKVRQFLNEYDGIPLEFCKAKKASYDKMLNCLGRTNYQYHPVTKLKSDKPVKAIEPDHPLLLALELKELVIDKSGEQEPIKEELSRATLIKPKSAKILRVIENVNISINDRIGISIGKCLLHCLKNGTLDWSNNSVEREIRRLAKYCNNSFFIGSPEGGVRLTRSLTIFANCKAYNIDPYKYLCNVFRRIKNTAKDQMVNLVVYRWQSQMAPAIY